ncbi:LysR family transcriptional regulator substrate-binding protein [Streptomyces sp. WMMC897]|uniref:LysR family transcriptional regulator substrate-binding protein n=1 Tax=Streptomyces sp. WMMC897 TaxID=3014782 RepID=UPI0022B6FF3F|nr:LysR family transcriptional regulator substrate-binding protein [Streptomyces sp. WMMC897]MCZ7416063.1 LysR family transcriptional regulator substrate-binding protein [Streptomyces sp. WMMC897]
MEVLADLPAGEVLRRLRSFELDAGITYLREDVAEGFRTLRLYEERYALLTSMAEELARQPSAAWSEASRLPLCLLAPNLQGRQLVDEVFTGLGLRAAPRVETDSVPSLFAHVRTDRWASTVPYAGLHVFGVPPGMRAVPLVEPERTAPIGLVTGAREPGPVIARALLEAARHIDTPAVLEGLPPRPGA